MKLTKYVGWKKEKLEYFTLLYIESISIIVYYVVEYYDGLKRIKKYYEREDETCHFSSIPSLYSSDLPTPEVELFDPEYIFEGPYLIPRKITETELLKRKPKEEYFIIVGNNIIKTPYKNSNWIPY